MQFSMLTDIWCQQPHTFKNSEPSLPISRLLKVRFICILILEPFRVPLWKVPKQIEGLEKVVKKASHPTKPKGCQNPRAPGAAALTKRPSISKGWGHGALGIFLALPVWQHRGTVMQGHMPACSSASVHKQKFLEVCVGWGSSAPTASLLLWFGEAGVLHAEKCNRLPWGHGRGGHQKLQMRSSSLPLFRAEPCWTQPFKKNKQTRNKGSLTHRHHWVSLLRRKRGEEVLPMWISTWKWANLADSPSVQGFMTWCCGRCYGGESRRTQGPCFIDWSVWFGPRPTFLYSNMLRYASNCGRINSFNNWWSSETIRLWQSF